MKNLAAIKQYGMFISLAAIFSFGQARAESLPPHQTDSEIRQVIIRESIAQYPGTCACPYNLARNGSRCGRRSAYSKPSGYSPLCYPGDVTDAMVSRYRKQHSTQHTGE